jgi:hypothetical protein
MAREKLKVNAAKAEEEGAENGRRRPRQPRSECWRCAMKGGAPRRRGGRRSRAFRKICANCADWRGLTAANQRALGRMAFVPGRIRLTQPEAPRVEEPEESDVQAMRAALIRRLDERLERNAWFKPPDMTPVSE